MYQKRKMRKNKKMNEDTKKMPSTSINWYPGHMAKTKDPFTRGLFRQRGPRAFHQAELRSRLQGQCDQHLLSCRHDLLECCIDYQQLWLFCCYVSGHYLLLTFRSTPKGFLRRLFVRRAAVFISIQKQRSLLYDEHHYLSRCIPCFIL